jgi:hypothetical protein
MVREEKGRQPDLAVSLAGSTRPAG